jgi:NADH:ubiquinone oxidoreductase subunit H
LLLAPAGVQSASKLSIVGVVMISQSLSLVDIANDQAA